MTLSDDTVEAKADTWVHMTKGLRHSIQAKTLLLPAVQKVRAAAATVKCKNNVKQLALAVHNYEDANGTFPAGSITYTPPGLDGEKTVDTWTITLLPYLEQNNLFAL